MSTFDTTDGQQPTYVDHDVIDPVGDKVGVVSDVIYDDTDGELIGTDGATEPTWLIVDPGRLRASHYVPAVGSRRAEDGSIVIPWEKRQVSSAPKAGREHVLTDIDRHELIDHYALR